MDSTILQRGAKARVLIGLAVGIVLVAAAMSRVGPEVRPGGPTMIELELSRRVGTFQQVLCDWSNPDGIPKIDPSNPCSTADANATSALVRARWAVVIDFLFIILYAWFMSGVQVWLGAKLRPFVVLPWVAGAFDVLENICLLWLIPTTAAAIPAVSAFGVHVLFAVSATKWALIAVSVLSTLTALLGGERGRVIWLVRYSLLSVAFGSVPLVATDQGRDLLVTLASSDLTHRVAFTVCGWLWGLSVWYWSRLVVNVEFGSRLDEAANRWALEVPLVLGALTFALPGVGAIAVLKEFDDKLLPALLAAGCFGSTLVFVVLARRRQAHLRAIGDENQKPVIPLAGKRATWIAVGISAILLSVFAMSPIYVPNLIGATAVLALAAAGVVLFGSVAVLLSRSFRAPLDVILVALAAVFSLWNDNHQIRSHPRDPGARRRDGLITTFDSWRQTHGIQDGDHVMLVASEGGGLRAAYWTASALSTSFIPADQAKKIFAISGVSGGAIGAAAYGAFRSDGQPHEQAAQAAVRMLKTPLLAPVLARLFNGEFLQWFLWFPVESFDRALVFERSLAEAYAPVVPHHPNAFERDYLQLWTGNAATDPPALLFTSTSVEHGSRIVASPFQWPTSRTDRADLNDLIDGDVSLAQAAHNSARFTYVSPVGQLYSADGQAKGGLVDGGYFENSGAEALLDLMQEIRSVHGDQKFDVVFICSSPGACPEFPPKRGGEAGLLAATRSTRVTSPWVPLEALGEILGPVRALYRARPAHESLALRRLYEAATDWQMIAICTGPAVAGVPEPPLGWEMSKRMTDLIDARTKTGDAAYACSRLAGVK
jgi:NAD(P)-dependent dehydrogenase (short-subunit alcohol dehydrogenase family)